MADEQVPPGAAVPSDYPVDLDGPRRNGSADGAVLTDAESITALPEPGSEAADPADEAAEPADEAADPADEAAEPADGDAAASAEASAEPADQVVDEALDELAAAAERKHPGTGERPASELGLVGSATEWAFATAINTFGAVLRTASGTADAVIDTAGRAVAGVGKLVAPAVMPTANLAGRTALALGTGAWQLSESSLRTAIRVIVNLVLDEVDLDAIIRDRVDLDAAVAQVDLDAAVARVDLDAAVARVDLDAAVARVDLDQIIDRVDVAKVIDKVDLDGVVATVNLDAAVARVDLDAVIDRVDVGRVIDKVDLDGVVAGVDIDAVAARIDLDAIIARMDLIGLANTVIDGIDLPGIIRDSTGSLGTETVMSIRSQTLNADDALSGFVGRLFGRSERIPDRKDATPELPS